LLGLHAGNDTAKDTASGSRAIGIGTRATHRWTILGSSRIFWPSSKRVIRIRVGRRWGSRLRRMWRILRGLWRRGWWIGFFGANLGFLARRWRSALHCAFFWWFPSRFFVLLIERAHRYPTNPQTMLPPFVPFPSTRRTRGTRSCWRHIYVFECDCVAWGRELKGGFTIQHQEACWPNCRQ
jgi:hypothetical protein